MKKGGSIMVRCNNTCKTSAVTSEVDLRKDETGFRPKITKVRVRKNKGMDSIIK